MACTDSSPLLVNEIICSPDSDGTEQSNTLPDSRVMVPTEYVSFPTGIDSSQEPHGMRRPNMDDGILGWIEIRAPGDWDFSTQSFEPAVNFRCVAGNGTKDGHEQTHALPCTWLGEPRRMCRKSPKARRKAEYLEDPSLSTLP